MTSSRYTRREMLTLMSAPVVVTGAGMFTSAEAATYWNVFGTVDIGGVHFSIGVHSPHVRPYGRYPGYYYRTSRRIKHRKYRCGRYCHHRDYYYHHESCPLLGWHLARHGGPPAYYAPAYLRHRDPYYRHRLDELDDYEWYEYDNRGRYPGRGRHRGRGWGRRR